MTTESLIPKKNKYRTGNNYQRRTKSRRALLQALYQWEVGKQYLIDIEKWFLEEQDLRGADIEYFIDLLHQIPANVASLDIEIFPFTQRSENNNIDVVELTALRIAVYELIHRPDIPYRVIIDESIELVKRFGSKDGYRFVNGVIHHLAKKLRTKELNTHIDFI